MKRLIIVDIFSIFFLELEIYCQGRLQKLSQQTNWIFFTYRVIHFGNKLPNQIKPAIDKKKNLWLNQLISEKNAKKKK